MISTQPADEARVSEDAMRAPADSSLCRTSFVQIGGG
jgi:hypothetical protein